MVGHHKGTGKTISIHSLRMEGDFVPREKFISNAISIHSLRMEGDDVSAHHQVMRRHFNPLPPHGGRLFQEVRKGQCSHFNPLPPHGGRHHFRRSHVLTLSFQSTPSAWRETFGRAPCAPPHANFNPLPPHGGRHERLPEVSCQKYFNPLPPHGGRRGT